MLRMSITLSRKVGQPDYGSLGASCGLDLEVESSLVEDRDSFQEKIHRLYALASQAVDEQLLSQSNGNGQPSANGRGATSPNGNANDSGDTLASNKQIKYLLDIARQRHQMDLARTAQFCDELVGTNDVYRLTKRQASSVIDRLNGKNGNGRG